MRVRAEALIEIARQVLSGIGCPPTVADLVAAHLVDADLKGHASHGTLRLPIYARQADVGYYDPAGEPVISRNDRGAPLVDGRRGFGMPAAEMAVDLCLDQLNDAAVAAVGIVNCGHTGRLGAYVERLAEAGCFAMITGGGGRETWRQVAPFGGAKALLSTNPFAFGMPGGERGAVVVDFATSAQSGGKLLLARAERAEFAEGVVAFDAEDRMPAAPDHYPPVVMNPMGGPKGYGMALIAELLGEAILGPKAEFNWILIAMDLSRYGGAESYRAKAEEILAELRNCPPAEGFQRVEVPGERERELEATQRRDGIEMSDGQWREIVEAADRFGIDWRGRCGDI